jgi:hypothetical protein
MKYIVLTVLLAVVRTLPPVPRQTTNSIDGTARSVKENSNDNQGPTAKPTTTLYPIAPKPDQNPSDAPSSKDTEQSIRVRELPSVSVHRDWADWVLWVFNGLLVIAGFLGIRVAYKTLKTLERQARSTHHQAVQVRKQTGLLTKSAEAALLNAQAVIDSERAWIHADFISREIIGVTRYSLVITNQGKTPAQVFGYHIWHGLLTEGVPFAKEKLTTHFTEESHVFIGGGQTMTLRDDFRLEDLFMLEDLTPAASAGFPQGAFCVTVNYGDVVTEKAKREEHHTSLVYFVNLTFSTLTRIAQYNDYT